MRVYVLVQTGIRATVYADTMHALEVAQRNFGPPDEWWYEEGTWRWEHPENPLLDAHIYSVEVYT